MLGIFHFGFLLGKRHVLEHLLEDDLGKNEPIFMHKHLEQQKTVAEVLFEPLLGFQSEALVYYSVYVLQVIMENCCRIMF